MSTTVHEALMNAQRNFANFAWDVPAARHPFFTIAKEQLDNALRAIENGKGLDFVIQESIEADVDVGDHDAPR